MACPWKRQRRRAGRDPQQEICSASDLNLLARRPPADVELRWCTLKSRAPNADSSREALVSGLADVEHQPNGSGGQRQRVAIARALVIILLLRRHPTETSTRRPAAVLDLLHELHVNGNSSYGTTMMTREDAQRSLTSKTAKCGRAARSPNFTGSGLVFAPARATARRRNP